MKDAIQIPCDPQPEDWGWECPTCQTKIGKAFRPMGTCSCGRPWVVLDAEGKRTAESFPINDCPGCAGSWYDHSEFCPHHPKNKIVNQPPVYDLAEFERQLEQAYQTAEESDWVMETILKCLKASKREAK